VLLVRRVCSMPHGRGGEIVVRLAKVADA